MVAFFSHDCRSVDSVLGVIPTAHRQRAFTIAQRAIHESFIGKKRFVDGVVDVGDL